VLVSSLAAAGPGTPARPVREDDPARPINAYGRSKLASEDVVRTLSRTPWTIVRPCAVYGPRDRGFRPLFRLAQRGRFFYAAPPSTFFTLIYVEDLIKAMLVVATDDRAIGGTFFVGHPEPQTTDDLLRALADTYGVSYRPRSVPSGLIDAAATLGELAWKLGRKPVIDRSRLAEFRAEGFVCSVDRLRDVLGFVAATSLREGVALTANSYA
jgi:nucleoside-diphosphate-sugar epimerase